MNWVGDGKEGASFEVSGENEISLDGGKRGTPFNVRMDQATGNDYYFQLNLTQVGSSLSIGVVTPSEFSGGWRTSGMFYNGNLTSGSAAKATSWGPRFGAGDTIGARVTQGGGTVEVAFYKNGNSLGTGFRLAANNNVYFPCIHVDGEAKMTLEIPAELPSKDLHEEAFSGMDGPWKLVEAVNESGNQLEIPSARPIELKVKRTSDDALQLGFKVGNQVSGGAKILQDNGTMLQIQTSHFMSSRMMPPPQLREIENLISGLSPDTMSLQGNQLILAREPKRTVWERLARTPQTLTSY